MKLAMIVAIVLLFNLNPVGAQDSNETPLWEEYLPLISDCPLEEAAEKLPSQWLEAGRDALQWVWSDANNEEERQEMFRQAISKFSCAAQLRPDHWEAWGEMATTLIDMSENGSEEEELGIDLAILAWNLGWGEEVSNLPSDNRNFIRAMFINPGMEPGTNVPLYQLAIDELKAEGAPNEEVGGVYKGLLWDMTVAAKNGYADYNDVRQVLEAAKQYLSLGDYLWHKGWLMFEESGADLFDGNPSDARMLERSLVIMETAGDNGIESAYKIVIDYRLNNQSANEIAFNEAKRLLLKATLDQCSTLKAFVVLFEAQDRKAESDATAGMSDHCPTGTVAASGDETQLFEAVAQDILRQWSTVWREENDPRHEAAQALYYKSFDVQSEIWMRESEERIEELDGPFLETTPSPSQ